ncbi:RNA polymerase-binding protein DksA [candidate division CSSED10-310 bacterium]|uniref:RNA polymerase-binding protein DksA n=1 Tax=candidate division CSSED10-310 bacterium TaxID=2855610 RepID=A0ABV6YW49_UNCC1
MEKEQFQHFTKLLLEKKAKLVEDATRTLAKDDIKIQDYSGDFADIASGESYRDFLLRIRDREAKLIKKIDKALSRIKEGSFGICDDCGEEIGFKRLEARPVTTLCIQCKTKQEELEKARE